ncbi:UDP-N-acetylmuramoyl-tripeptide--D-alanyl-D-alanine ligase [PVC group bacterium]|nr:UDP-N-acetylmuramoyl-tripeptide--D-alanyl-D-alanine ligase [PVC group bacterium]
MYNTFHMRLKDVQKSLSARWIQKGSLKTFKHVSIDSRQTKKGDLFWAIHGARFDGNQFVQDAFESGAVAAVVTQAAQGPWPSHVSILKIADGIKALQKYASVVREQYFKQVIGVVGSNGKTSTKNMIEHLLKPYLTCGKTISNYNNHIGLPLSCVNTQKACEVFIAEMGMSHFGEIGCLGRILKPNTVVFTNIGLAHLEGVKNLKGVLRAKEEVLNHLPHGASLVLNADDAKLRTLTRHQKFRIITYGFSRHADFHATIVKRSLRSTSFLVNGKDVIRLPCLGDFNVYNALAALATAHAVVPKFRLNHRVFAGICLPGMRTEIRKKKGILFINDAYNSNPTSVKASLGMLSHPAFQKKRKVFVCGDMLELGRYSVEWHRRLGRHLKSSQVDILIAIGSKAEAMAKEAAKHNSFPIYQFCDVDEFRQDMHNIIRSGDVVLLKASRLIGLEKILNKK